MTAAEVSRGTGERAPLRPLDWEELLTLALTLATTLSVAASVQRAAWVNSMTSLWVIAVLAVLLGYAAVHASLRSYQAHLLSLVAGFGIVLWQLLSVIEGEGLRGRWDGLWARLWDWVVAAVEGGVSTDPLPFVALLSVLFWAAPYIATWSVFRWRNPWLALLPLGAIILVNIANLPGQFDFALVVFLFSAVLLTMRLFLRQRMHRWRQEGTGYPEFLSLSALHNTFWVAVVLLAAAWAVPPANELPGLSRAWDLLRAPVVGVASDFERLFLGVHSKQPPEIPQFSQVYPLRGPLVLGGRVLFSVRTAEPVLFLRVGSYDRYTGDGWLASPRQSGEEAIEPEDEALGPEEMAQARDLLTGLRRRVVTAVIRPANATSDLLTIGVPLGASVEGHLELAPVEPYVLEVADEAGLALVPGDLERFARSVGRVQEAEDEPPSLEEVRQLLPRGYYLLSIERDDDGIVTGLVVTEGDAAYDPLRLVAVEPVQRGQDYVSAGAAAEVSAPELRQVPPTTDPLILQRYLQLPASLPQRVRELALEVAGGAETPFDQALAVESFLRLNYPVDTAIPPTPPGRDPVDYFLLDLKRGYSDYHASAMVVLLRSLGIPARLTTGYYLDTAEYNAEGDYYLVRQRHAFSWPEVYFAGVGWVEFSPTPGVERTIQETARGAVSPLAQQALGLGSFQGDPNTASVTRPGTAVGAEVAPAAGSGGASVLPFAILGAVGALLALLALGARLSWERSVAGLSYPAQLWEKTLRLASWAGLRQKPQQTPREYAGTLAQEFPDIRGIHDLGEAYGRSQFGKKKLTPEEQRHLRGVWRRLRRALLGRLIRHRRPPRDEDD